MNKLALKTVGEIAATFPSATPIFEKLKIDYCCGGGVTLKDACETLGLNVEEVSRNLEREPQAAESGRDIKNWTVQPLSDLITHIVTTHHVFTKAELARLDPLLAKVRSVHGQNHPELQEIHRNFQALSSELISHMRKEEGILFPFILQMEEAINDGTAIPVPPFGTLQNPIRMMEIEHAQAGDALEEMRQLSKEFTVPPDGCGSFQALYQALAALDADLHQHIHLENNILFPRAIAMEHSKPLSQKRGA